MHPFSDPFGDQPGHMRHPEAVEARVAEAQQHTRHRGQGLLAILGALVVGGMLFGIGYRMVVSVF